MTADPRVAVVSDARHFHALTGYGPDTRCVCGEWRSGSTVEWNDHCSAAVLAALDAYDREHMGALGAQAHAVLVHDIEANLRERIARDIEAAATNPCEEFDRGCACGRCESHEDWTDAARIARGGTP